MINLADPGILGAFGYGTAALAYGSRLTFGFPGGTNETENKSIEKAMAAIGFMFGGIAQLLTGIFLFAGHPGSPIRMDIATTNCIFGMLWGAIWLIEYFNVNTKACVYLDIAILVYTLFAGYWAYALGEPLVAYLLWSITVLNVFLIPVHVKGTGKVIAGIVALENCLIAYYVCYHVMMGTIH